MEHRRMLRGTSATARVAHLARIGAHPTRTGFCGAAALATALVLASGTVLAGCATAVPPATSTASASAASPGSAETPSPAPAESLGEPGAPGCLPASPQAVDEATGFTEVQGTAAAGDSLYGLVRTDIPLAAGEWVDEFVWRMTGDGDLVVTVTRPDGSPATVNWGPEPHGETSYQRPGDEWGTGIVFNTPGCWQLDFVRGAAAASVYLDIAP